MKSDRIVFSNNISAFERVILSSNGNLQNILTHYLDTDLNIKIIKNELSNDKIIREIIMCSGSTPLYKAVSEIDAANIDLVFKFLQNNGIGQYLSSKGKVPMFRLIDYSKNEFLYRKYELKVDGFKCVISENYLIKF